MLIEWLKVKVPPELREQYIQKDDEIWTPLLASYPGFAGKEVWINPKDPMEIVMVIHWESRDGWKSIPVEKLEETDRQFAEAMGQAFPFAEEGEYQVRKFMQRPT
ncbi:TIGR03792 family protein [Phormidesmis priestleyi ULC007]|uniref:TIGR03792 family protein n=1 Tax=Phormidesmis priestleyi ULC007 TaxID=1920490 RepID=A0A2T1D7E9_9CYAN|nr:TIGR03792 family protein [Phormidesmis priestleyi]PSB16418.1 TIGR03792 family protein [Phormidesmis priestleyi ULC007]PZO47348.1 MAG: TIGR03792 family protein [Phormidesmis priestleyi]